MAKEVKKADPAVNAHKLEKAMWSTIIGAQYSLGLIQPKADPLSSKKVVPSKKGKGDSDEDSRETRRAKDQRGLKRLMEEGSSEDTEPVALSKKPRKDS